MHIVLANRWYPPQAHGGVAVYNFYLAQALVKLGHQVTVVAAASSPQEAVVSLDGKVRVYRTMARHYARLQRLPVLGRYMRVFQQMQYSLAVLKQLRQIEAVNPPDVIEFAEVNAEAWAYLRQEHRYPVVVRCHTPTFILRQYYEAREISYDTNLTSQLEKFCIKQADALTAPSQDMANTIASHVNIRPDLIRVIPNLLDTSLFATERDTNTPKDEVVILHVGRLDRAKGIEVLAQAIPSVIQRCPNAQFVYVGDDRPDGEGSTWRTRLLTYFQAQNVDHCVTFTGSVNQPTLLDWYRRADIAVVPSILYESFSYTVVQAMAAGLAIVATDIGGIRETVAHTGIIVPPHDVQALSNALINLITQADVRVHLSKQACNRAQQEFDSCKVAQTMAEFYAAVI